MRPALTGTTSWTRGVAAPVRAFLGTETGSAVVLLGAAIAALVWANGPWSDSYTSVWTTVLSVRLGSDGVALDLRHWVNDGLMTFFFLVVGLEAKRELALGELRERRRLALPLAGAIGGMAVPVAIYLAVNAGGDGAHGWGAAMSTDTAFALSALAIVAPRAPSRLRVFLLSLVVFDDLAALAVIAVAYSQDVSLTALGVALGLFALLLALRYAPAGRSTAAAVVATAMWVALHESGIDPATAGLAIGLVTSAYPPSREDLERATSLMRAFREQPTPELARSVQLGLASTLSPNDRMQLRLHPLSSYVVVPLFALANAGVHLGGGLLGDAVTSPVTLGIVAAYVAGKPAGIVLATWVATRRGLRLPVTWPGLAATASAAGIGFTLSLLIASLAFAGRQLEEAKIGALATLVISPLVAFLLFRVIALLPSRVRARQLRAVAPDILDLTDDVDPERDHIRGSGAAPVTLVEYGDFECPYCGQAEPIVRELLVREGDDLCYVWRHLPLPDVHPHAELAAEAAEAAGAQGAFWEMHDALLADQDHLRPVDLTARAQMLGLDVERFRDELRNRVHAERVAEDVASADRSGVAGTPTFFVNGRRHQGAYDLETLTAAVRDAYARAMARA